MEDDNSSNDGTNPSMEEKELLDAINSNPDDPENYKRLGDFYLSFRKIVRDF